MFSIKYNKRAITNQCGTLLTDEWRREEICLKVNPHFICLQNESLLE